MSNQHEDYSDAPISLGEVRSDISRNAAEWTPREALISVLRDIDKGLIDPQALVIIHSVRVRKGVTRTRFTAAGSDLLTTLGMMDYAKQSMMLNADIDDAEED